MWIKGESYYPQPRGHQKFAVDVVLAISLLQTSLTSVLGCICIYI